MNAIAYYDQWNWMQEEAPTDWAETSTPEIVHGTTPHTIITNTIGRKDNLYNLYRNRRFYWRVTLWNTPRTELNEFSAGWKDEFGVIWTLQCARPDSATCTVKMNKILINKICELNGKFKSQQRVYQFTQVESRNESYESDQSI